MALYFMISIILRNDNYQADYFSQGDKDHVFS